MLAYRTLTFMKLPKMRVGFAPALCLAALTACSSLHRTNAESAGAVAHVATPSQAAVASTPSAAPFLGRWYPSQGHTHLNAGEPDDFVYSSNPPTSGPHREMFTDTFVSPVPLPKYVQVHLLEHGNVLLQYNCSCPDLASALASIAMVYDVHLMPTNELQPTSADVQNGEDQGLAVIVAPYPNMKSRIALTAWTRLATLDALDKAKILSFINAYLHNDANAGQ
jgi:hypothetical protein